MLMLLYSLNKKKVPKKFIWSWQHAHRHAMILVAQRRLLDLISVPIGMPWPMQVKIVNKISQHFHNIFLRRFHSFFSFFFLRLKIEKERGATRGLPRRSPILVLLSIFILTYELLITQLL